METPLFWHCCSRHRSVDWNYYSADGNFADDADHFHQQKIHPFCRGGICEHRARPQLLRLRRADNDDDVHEQAVDGDAVDDTDDLDYAYTRHCLHQHLLSVMLFGHCYCHLR